MLARITLAIDAAPLRRELRRALTQPDVLLETLEGKDLHWERTARENCDLIVVSRTLIPDPAAETIGVLRQLPDFPGVVIVSEREDAAERASLLAAGCEAVLNARLPGETLRSVITTILARRKELLEREPGQVRPAAKPRLADFVSASQAMQAFMGVARRVVASDVSLLILGETGVGKERLARAIQAEGHRAEGPFVTVNCGAIPETLLESELFGHEEGAFTGAARARRGLFELAHHGTVFLDEIGDLPSHLQVKLLRFLQDHEIQRLGSEKLVKVDVRVMAATNRDLAAEVEARRFRRDLFYRLSVVTLTIPPLRERREDIPALVESYINYFRPRIGREAVASASPEALDALARYAWPGNVRELINVVERAMLLCSGARISPRDLPEVISRHQAEPRLARAPIPLGTDSEGLPEEWLGKPLRVARGLLLARFERAYLAGLLAATGGRIGATARRAGIEPRSLFDKMRRHGLHKEDFRPRSQNARGPASGPGSIPSP